MQKYLNPSKLKLISKGVDSVRSRVANILDYLPGVKISDIGSSLIKAFDTFHGEERNVYVFDSDKNGSPSAILNQAQNPFQQQIIIMYYKLTIKCFGSGETNFYQMSTSLATIRNLQSHLNTNLVSV
jgi:hypothetical protein